MRIRRLSGPARTALWLWIISLAASAAIMIVAASKAKAGYVSPAYEPVVVFPLGGLLVGAIVLAGIAVGLAVLAVILAMRAARPRGGI